MNSVPLYLIGIVLVGALLHASWNALIKSGPDKELDTALVHVIGGVMALPIVLIVGFPKSAVWPYLLASLTIHIGYYIALVGAYKHGDLGLTYPIMRGTAPLLVALGSGFFLGEPLSLAAWIGILAISLGVFAAGWRKSASSAQPSTQTTAIRYALTNACIIAIYTIVDGIGVRMSGDPLAYVATLFLFDGIPYALMVAWQRRARLGESLTYVRARAPVASLGALASLGSYGIAIWAMAQAPVAMVAALRETSVLFAALIGVVWLKENFGVLRLCGTLLIVVGIVSLRLL